MKEGQISRSPALTFGNEVIMQLPLNWYENIDLLGFSLFSFQVPVNVFKEQAEDELKGEDSELCI